MGVGEHGFTGNVILSYFTPLFLQHAKSKKQQNKTSKQIFKYIPQISNAAEVAVKFQSISQNCYLS